MAVETQGPDLVSIVALLGAGVLAVPIFKRLGLGSVLGYLAAGVAIGPFVLGLFSDAQAVIHVAELGVVMFLFIIGLEMQPSRLWGLRREIFGLGALQVGVCALLLTGVGTALGLSPLVAFVAAAGFVLTSTAIVMQILEEAGEATTPKGQKIVSILLLEDLTIVPLLALISFLSPNTAESSLAERLVDIAIAIGAVAALVAAGRWLLNPMFRILASAQAREVMTAAALLVVLGSALAMQVSGLSMAMGAFLAGVLLSESSFRHQLEADIEPFRGILLGLFFLGVGMALDLPLIADNWRIIAVAVLAFMSVKALTIYCLARVLKTGRREALGRAVLMAQGGEFAFVLYAAADAGGIIDGPTNAMLTATVIISMALTPLAIIAVRRALPKPIQSMAGVEIADGLESTALIIGFGRFGQIVSQPLIARGINVSIIETDTERIRGAAEFGFKVYYGDGSRLDILRAAGAGNARAILVCVNGDQTANRIVALVKSEFPLVPLLVRAWDREHALELIHAGVDYQIRETFESAMTFSGEALRRVGVEEDAVQEILADIRRRDDERLDLELCDGLYAGRALIYGNAGQIINPDNAPLSDGDSLVPAGDMAVVKS